jgi:hypothetical protein
MSSFPLADKTAALALLNRGNASTNTAASSVERCTPSLRATRLSVATLILRSAGADFSVHDFNLITPEEVLLDPLQ